MSSAPQRGFSRPAVLPDAWGRVLRDPATGTLVGIVRPLGRERVVTALPLKQGPQQLLPPVALVDAWGCCLVDASGVCVGAPALYVSRLLSARFSADTRRL